MNHVIKTTNPFFGKINENKTLNEDGFRNFVANEMAIEDRQKAVAANITTKCIQILNEYPDKDRDHVKLDATDCNAIEATVLFYCADLEFMKSCPTDLQDPSLECVELRSTEIILETEMSFNAEICCNVTSSAHIALAKKIENMSNECKEELGMFDMWCKFYLISVDQ